MYIYVYILEKGLKFNVPGEQKNQHLTVLSLSTFLNFIFFSITNLVHKFFILIYLLHSCTCIEHYCAHLQ